MAAIDVVAWIDKHLAWNEAQIEKQEMVVASLESGGHRTFMQGAAGMVDTTVENLAAARAAL